jgi:hypothetical protein
MGGRNREFKGRLGYRVRPCLKKQKQSKMQKGDFAHYSTQASLEIIPKAYKKMNKHLFRKI